MFGCAGASLLRAGVPERRGVRLAMAVRDGVEVEGIFALSLVRQGEAFGMALREVVSGRRCDETGGGGVGPGLPAPHGCVWVPSDPPGVEQSCGCLGTWASGGRAVRRVEG